VQLSDVSASEDVVPVPRYVHVLWCVKATAPVTQCLITLMYWGLLYRPALGPVTPVNVIAHGKASCQNIAKTLPTCLYS
jgi:hypothetical protein